MAAPSILTAELPSLPYVGTLDKRSEMLGFWQPRKVQLERGALRYFKDGCVEPRAAFAEGDVLGVDGELPSTILLRARRAGGEERTFQLRAADVQEMMMWVALIRTAFDLPDDGSGPVPSISPSRSFISTPTSLFSRASGFVSGKVAGVAKITGSDTWLDEKLGFAKDTIESAKRSTARWREQLELQMEEAITSCDEGKTEMLLDMAMSQGFTGDHAPAIVRRAARRVAGRRLRDAVEAGDAKRLKGALLAAKRLQAVDVPEFPLAVEKYREVQKFPAGWDVGKMVAERRAGAAKFFTKSDVSANIALKALVQLMFDRTNRRVETRDRKGEPIPLYLEVVQVSEVQNESQWVEYMMRREAIKKDIQDSAPPGMALPDGFLLAAVETEGALVEAEALAAQQDISVTAEAGLRPGQLTEWPSPVSGEVLRLTIPASSEVPLKDLLASALPGPPLETIVNEAWLFHGTQPIAAESITSGSFRVDLAGTSTGTLYGRGVYMAENVTKADEYSRRDPATGLCTMLLCRATLGRLLYTAEVHPDPRHCEDACLRGDCHAVLGDRKACRGTFREFCIFDEDQVYPNYIVQYRRVLP